MKKKEKKITRECLGCGKITPDTPCPHCGGGSFKVTEERVDGWLIDYELAKEEDRDNFNIFMSED